MTTTKKAAKTAKDDEVKADIEPSDTGADDTDTSSDIEKITEPVEGQERYDVWNEKTEHVKTFTEEEYKGEAFKEAKALADQHEGWYIT